MTELIYNELSCCKKKIASLIQFVLIKFDY